MSDGLIEYRVFPNSNTVAVKVIGDICFRQMVEFLVVLGRCKEFKVGMDSIYDLSACENISGDLRKLSRFSEAVSDEQHVNIACKTAFLLPQDNTRLLRLMEGIVLMMSESVIEHRLFSVSQRQDAYAFLNVSQLTKHDMESYLLGNPVE